MPLFYFYLSREIAIDESVAKSESSITKGRATDLASVVSENSSLSRKSAVRFLKVSGKGLPLL